MHSSRLPRLGMALVGTLLFVVWITPATAQEFSTLGLSAVPDAYVPVLETPVDEPFTLYLIVTGPEGTEPLPFDLYEVDWTVFTACCGATPVLVTEFVYPESTIPAGDPFETMKSTAVSCLDDQVVLLATLSFDWSEEYAGLTEFPVSAGAASPAEDCLGDYHILMGLHVQIIGITQTPNQALTWGGLKATYSD